MARHGKKLFPWKHGWNSWVDGLGLYLRYPRECPTVMRLYDLAWGGCADLKIRFLYPTGLGGPTRSAFWCQGPPCLRKPHLDWLRGIPLILGTHDQSQVNQQHQPSRVNDIPPSLQVKCHVLLFYHPAKKNRAPLEHLPSCILGAALNAEPRPKGSMGQHHVTASPLSSIITTLTSVCNDCRDRQLGCGDGRVMLMKWSSIVVAETPETGRSS